MEIELSPKQRDDQASFRRFVDSDVLPAADRFDTEERIEPDVIGQLGSKGYLGAVIPEQYGGISLDMLTFGLLNEEIGRGCSSLRSLLTVHSMVSHAVLKWGTPQQKEYWLPQLASGGVLAAFCLTEPSVGSDARNIETVAEPSGDSYVINGRKKWISFGQVADLFLVLAQSNGKPAAFIVERQRQGVSVKPISGLLGLRASLLAEVNFEGCRVPKENLVGRLGFGLSHVFGAALDCGRYSVAWGSVGIAQGCVECCLRYTSERRQGGALLREHQLIQKMITDSVTSVKAARLLCYRAAYLKDSGDPRAISETMIAKYFASRVAVAVAGDAIQMHGAMGCSSESPVGRYLRDAKIMEIIEGSSQVLQINIARQAYDCYGPSITF